jgi:deoxyribose-phosphate aldolase
MEIDKQQLASMIDHTQLKAGATLDDILRLTDEAKIHGFGAVCVNPYWVPTAREQLEGTHVRIACVVGFPLGQNKTSTKEEEGRAAIGDGADELDMVINIAALKSQRFADVEDDIAQVVSLGVPVKVIIEACELLHEEKVMACELAKRAGAAYVKTSTGFGRYGATVDDVALMRRIVGDDMGVKAAGGISTLEGAMRMIEAGATRIGASQSVRIVEEL